MLAPEIPDLVLRRFLLKNLGRDAIGGFFWKMNLGGLAQNYLQLCDPLLADGPFAKPALFIRGGKSDYMGSEDETIIGKMFLQARIENIAEAGHWVHADQPEEFLRLVLNFLKPV